MSQASAVKNVVLVQGGFVDGSGWQGIYDLLRNDLSRRAPLLPSRSMKWNGGAAKSRLAYRGRMTKE